jgi:hypothetical protein
MSKNTENNLKTVEIKEAFQTFIAKRSWQDDADKARKDLTLKDIDRTDAIFGGIVAEIADGAHGQTVIGGLPKDVIREKVSVGFALGNRPLKDAEQELLFHAVCDQLFQGSELNEEEENTYRCFLKYYMHQNALYQQSAKLLGDELGKENVLIEIERSYQPRLYFKDKVLYFEDEVTSTKLFNAFGETREVFVKLETLLRIQKLENSTRMELTVEKCTASYTPNPLLEEVFKALKAETSGLKKVSESPKKKVGFFRLFSNNSSRKATTKDGKPFDNGTNVALIKVN